MKRIVVFFVSLMIMVLLVGIAISLTEDQEKQKDLPISKLGDLLVKTPTQAQKGLLVAQANILWRTRLGLQYTTVDVTHYREYNNDTTIYLEFTAIRNIQCTEMPNCGTTYIQGNKVVCDCSWKWQTGTGNFNDIIG